MRRWTVLMLVVVYLSGCTTYPHQWMPNVTSEHKATRTVPVNVAVVANDLRPEYSMAGWWLGPLSLGMIPYTSGKMGGIPDTTPHPNEPGFGGYFFDYEYVLPLLVAKELRESQLVSYAGIEEDSRVLTQYELVLELTLNDCYSLIGGIWYFGLAAVVCLLGVPMQKLKVEADLDWKLVEQCSNRVLGQGKALVSESVLSGYYYNIDPAPVVHQQALPDLIEQIVAGIDNALDEHPPLYWTSLAKKHEEWRLAKGDILSYKQPTVRMASDEPSSQVQIREPPASESLGRVDAKRIWRPGVRSRQWVVCVGVSQCRNRSVPPNLYARKDAERVAEWFGQEQGTHAPDNNVYVLYDEQATRENVMTQIDWLRRHAMPEDLVVVYFACHGAPEVAPDGKSVDAKYLVLHDTDPKNLFATALPLDELTRCLDMVKANVQLVLLECCYAGPVGREVLAKTPTADLEIRPRQIQEMGSRTGRIILTASSGRQVALSSPDFEAGLFTHYLLNNLGDGDKLLLRDCFEGVWDSVRRKAAEMGSWQEPQKFGDANIDIMFRAAKTIEEESR